MKTKLTLTIDKEVVIEAKKYSRRHRISISNIVESELKRKIGVSIEKKKSAVKMLTGSLNLEKLRKIKDDKLQYLIKKHVH